MAKSDAKGKAGQGEPAHDIFPKGTWDQPKATSTKIGDMEPVIIYAAVGQALSVWETVEERLAFLYGMLSETDGEAVTRTFGCIENSGGRLKALSLAAEVYFYKYWNRREIKRPFLAIHDNVQKAAMRRNDLAHGKVEGFRPTPQEDKSEIRSTLNGYYLLAPRYMAMRNKHRFTLAPSDTTWAISSNYCYVSSDINDMTSKFIGLKDAIFTYMIRCAKSGEERRIPIVEEMLAADAANLSQKGR